MNTLKAFISCGVVMLLGMSNAMAAKVEVCHFPFGNPDNWHTISVSDKALSAHLGHNDLEGSCDENCDTICDDGDACTIDVDPETAGCACLAQPEPVDCDDGNQCTVDSCSSVEGACVYDADVLDGAACDDGDPSTTGEVCNAGVCAVTAPAAYSCFDDPCDEGGPGYPPTNQLLPHVDRQAYIQCNLFFGCRVLDCGRDSEWSQAQLQCVPRQ